MAHPSPTETEKAQMNIDIKRAKEAIKDALRPFEEKFRHRIVGAALTDLDIEIK